MRTAKISLGNFKGPEGGNTERVDLSLQSSENLFLVLQVICYSSDADDTEGKSRHLLGLAAHLGS